MGIATFGFERTRPGCVGCHNAKRPRFKGFDFATASAKIRHWK
ncbi:MAG TPA: hypothetical protein VE404_05325 [Verrucomicrobiae bacterium]|nr:hypothetical protein [Verrucomicrobiae bacterium]